MYFITFLLLFSSPFLIPSSSSTPFVTGGGSSLSVEKASDKLVSPNGRFSAGFYPNGNNAFLFAVWFTKSFNTVIWTATGHQVNGKRSKLSLQKHGNLILVDGGENIIWSTRTGTNSSAKLSLLDTGNLVIANTEKFIIWQSFDYPTNTLLPNQVLTRDKYLISYRSRTNYSSGFYKLFFDNDNVLKLLYNGPDVSSIYWPDPWVMTWDAGRTTYNSSKLAVLDIYGRFTSSDSFLFSAVDFGPVHQRRLTLDFDGSLRLYSLDEATSDWIVTWQATNDPCRVHGICGQNSVCSYFSGEGRGCSCLPGYEAKDLSDWSYGCKLGQDKFEDDYEVAFVNVDQVELYGYEYDVFGNTTLESCKEKCAKSLVCKGFLLKSEGGVYNCYAKSQLLNGKHSPNLIGSLYVKLNVSRESSALSLNQSMEEMKLDCSGEKTIQLERVYETGNGSNILEFLVYLASAIGAVEFVIICTMSYFIFRAPKDQHQGANGYFLARTGFRRFSYSELNRSTRGFSEEIGRGANGVVYLGMLSDDRVAAVKRLNNTNGGEIEFLAELSIIGRLNHMNLIEMWGYCIEGKHRVLVSEYMVNGSLAENLYSNKLDCEHRFNIAVGIAKGLAYLHEECLEWVLHCDVKPQNILLDSNYNPKVADFGLSKLLNRGGYDSNFSTIRGTRGYMAPEWVSSHPITSKVDVYSYGIVVLEMITGKSPVESYQVEGEDEGPRRLVTWARKKIERAKLKGLSCWIIEIMDPNMMCNEDDEFNKIQNLVSVAMRCVEEDKDDRPTMRKVVEMLVTCED